MTINEASKLYNIPLEILHEYEKRVLFRSVKKVMGSWQYDDSDLENLSLIMTLHDIGFNIEEIENYMRLLLDKNNHSDKLQLYSLNKKRNELLDEIHFREKQLERLNYLRYKIEHKYTK